MDNVFTVWGSTVGNSFSRRSLGSFERAGWIPALRRLCFRWIFRNQRFLSS